jgi:hypothetical protein
MTDNTQKIIKELREDFNLHKNSALRCYSARLVEELIHELSKEEPNKDNKTPAKEPMYDGKVAARLRKEKKGNKDTRNKYDCRYYQFFNETSYLLLEATEFFSKEEIYEAIKRVHDKIISKG